MPVVDVDDGVPVTRLSGAISDTSLQDQLFIYPRSVTQRSWKRREGVVRRSCITIIIVVRKSWTRHAIRGGVVRRSCSGHFNQSRRSHTEVVSCDRYTKYYKSHGEVFLFRLRRRHGVHVTPCDWGITYLINNSMPFCTLIRPYNNNNNNDDTSAVSVVRLVSV